MSLDKKIVDTAVKGFPMGDLDDDVKSLQVLRISCIQTLQGDAGYLPAKLEEMKRPNKNEEEVAEERVRVLLEQVEQVESKEQRANILEQIALAALIFNPELEGMYNSLPELDKNISGLPVIALIDMLKDTKEIPSTIRELDYRNKFFTEIYFPDAKCREFNLSHGNFYRFVFDRSRLYMVDLGGCKILESSFEAAKLSKIHAESLIVKNSNLSKIAVMNSYFFGSDLSNVNLENSVWIRSNIDKSKFNSSNLNRIALARSSLRESKFIEVSLQSAKFRDCYLYDTTLANSNIDNSTFEGCDLMYTKFVDINADNLSITGCKGGYLDVRGAIGTQWLLENSSLVGARFKECKLNNSKWLGNKYFGIKRALRETEEECTQFNSDSISFTECELIGSIFEGENLWYSEFVNSDLRQANLRRVNLSESYIEDCDLSYSDMTGANLKETTFWHVNLTGAIMPDGTIFKDGCLEKFTGKR